MKVDRVLVAAFSLLLLSGCAATSADPDAVAEEPVGESEAVESAEPAVDLTSLDVLKDVCLIGSAIYDNPAWTLGAFAEAPDYWTGNGFPPVASEGAVYCWTMSTAGGEKSRFTGVALRGGSADFAVFEEWVLAVEAMGFVPDGRADLDTFRQVIQGELSGTVNSQWWADGRDYFASVSANGSSVLIGIQPVP